MDKEKVKEIKECLEEFKNDRIGYCTNGIDRFMLTKEDALTLINELESENERYKQSCGAIGQNSLTIINQQKDRIAALEKENEDYYDRLNNLQAYIDNHEEIWKRNTNNALKQFAERLKDKFNDTEYRAKTKRKTISIEELKAQMDWILHEVVIESIDETLKEFIDGKV